MKTYYSLQQLNLFKDGRHTWFYDGAAGHCNPDTLAAEKNIKRKMTICVSSVALLKIYR